MKQLLLELVNWLAPLPTAPPSSPKAPIAHIAPTNSEPTPRKLPPSTQLPAVPAKKTTPPSHPAAEGLPSEAELEAISRRLLIGSGYPDLAGKISVRWNGRLQSTAGRAHYAASKVDLNPRLVQFGAEEIDRTLRHELAHLLARFRCGRQKIAAHGKEWKKACADLGLPNEKRTHNLPLPRRKVERKHAYRCPNCQLEITRVKPFRAKVACMSCCRKFGQGRYDERFRLVKQRG